MKTTFINGACVLVEANGKKIICDPWFVGRAYHGSWAIYPPVNSDNPIFDEIDYIYISHIHPDHLHKESLDRINKDVPVLIHSFEEKFLKFKLQSWGREVFELKHGENFDCGNDVKLHIYAADNCDPKNSSDFFGLGKDAGSNDKSSGIDTVCVIEDGEYTILNVNDCPYALTLDTLELVLDKFGKPDLMLFPYLGAGSFPQCFESYTVEEKVQQAEFKKQKFLDMGLQFLNKCKPKHYLPFAGGYVLCGKMSDLNNFTGNASDVDALEFFKEKYKDGKGFLINKLENFDLKTEKVSKDYTPVDEREKKQYFEKILKFKKYDYENDEEPTLEDIVNLLPKAYSKFNEKRQQLNFVTDKNIYVKIPDDKMVKIKSSNDGYEIIDKSSFDDDKYVIYQLDFKLLHRILQGPKYAHWDNATVGSHIRFYRKPDVYEKKIHWCMNYFHS